MIGYYFGTGIKTFFYVSIKTKCTSFSKWNAIYISNICKIIIWYLRKRKIANFFSYKDVLGKGGFILRAASRPNLAHKTHNVSKKQIYIFSSELIFKVIHFLPCIACL